MSDQNLQSDQPNSQTGGDNPDMLGVPFWSANPVEAGAETTLSVPIEYTTKVVAGEYFGNQDPGQGNGKAMDVEDDHLVITMKVDLSIGSHPLNIRAKDENNVWSSLEATVLTVMSTPVISPDAASQQ
jgi:hypothetical protein